MDFTEIPSKEVIEKTIAGMKKRGFDTQFAENKEQALDIIKALIPAESTVMTGASETLEQIGFVDLLKSGGHQWKNLKDEIIAEQDQAKQLRLRREATIANYFLGSVHAVTETGETITASMSGSQLPAYAYNSDNVIWVIGAQKIVPDLEAGLKRIREYVLPLEDARMRRVSEGKMGSAISKLLIYEMENNQSHQIHAIIINEKFGF